MDRCAHRSLSDGGRTNMAGDFGLRQSVEMALTSTDVNYGSKRSATAGTFGGYFTFVVTNPKRVPATAAVEVA